MEENGAKSTKHTKNAKLPATSDGEVPRTRGRGGNSNFKNSLVGSKPQDISHCLKNCMEFYGRQIVKSDEECRERLYDFFDTCQRTGQLPTMEKMFMALGTVKGTVWDWEHGRGCSAVRTDLIKKAKGLIHAFESEMVTEGKINPVVYIFRAKNYFGMKDQQEVVVTPNQPLGEEIDQKQLEEKLADIVID